MLIIQTVKGVMLQAAGGQKNILEEHPCWLPYFLLLSPSILTQTHRQEAVWWLTWVASGLGCPPVCSVGLCTVQGNPQRIHEDGRKD